MKRLVKRLVKHLVTCEYDRLFLVFLFLAVGNSMSEDTKTMVAMETQPVVEPVKAEVSPDAGRRVETRDVEGEMEVGGGGEGSKEGRTVFVSNLSFSTTEKELEEKFSEVCLTLQSP